MAILAVKVRLTLLPAGKLKLPHAGVEAPATGLVMVGRVAPPLNAIAPVEAKVKPVGKLSCTSTLVAGHEPAAPVLLNTMV